MHDIAPITQALDFVERHLQSAIAVADIADAAGYSLYHFSRVFNTVTHHTPYDYLMRRRLAEATYTLLATDRKIIDIAFDYQFNNPETFSRAFRRIFESSPSQVRKRGHIDPRRLMPQLTPAHLRHRQRGTDLKPVLCPPPIHHLAGLMTHLRDDPDAVPDLWAMFARVYDAPAERYYGLTLYPPGWERDGRLYLAAVAVSDPQDIHPALVVKTLPQHRYVRFAHDGSRRDLALTLDYVYHTWQARAEVQCAGDFTLEDYGTHPGLADEGAAGHRLYIPLK